MSKSKGNSLDPLELIEAYSADALRFSIALITSLDCDTKVNKEKFEIGRNFCTKIWNAARFLEMQESMLEKKLPIEDVKDLTSDEKHIIYAANLACKKMEEILSQYRIQDGALQLYDFFWTEICDWYVEYSKDAPDKPRAFAILRDVFFKALKLLHPYMPFVTEEVAHELGYLGENDTIMLSDYPQGYSEEDMLKWGVSKDIYEFVGKKREAITALRALRAEYKLPPSAFVKVTIASDDKNLANEVESLKRAIRAESIDFVDSSADLAMPSKLTALGTVYLSLDGLIDKAAESKRIEAEILKISAFIKSSEAKLSNEKFVSHAPEAIVAEARRKLEENKEKLSQLQKLVKLFA
jgi:valyl-tRNA synthetase